MKIPKRTPGFLIQTVGLITLSSLIGHAPALAEPVFMGLGDLPGGSSMSRANAVSADGTTVVGDSRSAAGLEAFRWTFDGGMVGLGDLPGGDFWSEAFDVSGDGSIVVGYSKSGPGITYEAFRWEAGVMNGLGDFPGGSLFHSTATAISADGSVIVGQGSSEQGSEAFRWTAASGLVGLGDLPGGEFASRAADVSADGSVVVGISQTGNADGEAFRWTPSSGMVGLGFLPGGGEVSAASAVSGDGTVIFGGSDSASDGQAFRWTAEAGMLPIGHFAARALTYDGSLAVGSVFDDSQFQAVIWDELNGVRSLAYVLSADYGLDLSGWALLEARDVSADGTVIVGKGINPVGRTEAWLAVVPEPSSLTLLLAAFIWLRPNRRRSGYTSEP